MSETVSLSARAMGKPGAEQHIETTARELIAAHHGDGDQAEALDGFRAAIRQPRATVEELLIIAANWAA